MELVSLPPQNFASPILIKIMLGNYEARIASKDMIFTPIFVKIHDADILAIVSLIPQTFARPPY